MTSLVSQIAFAGGRTISYNYDEEERITNIHDSVDGETTYTYDAQGQLLSETKGTETVSVTYDNYGNILTKGGVAYTYDSVWKDRLETYDGIQIDYDAGGNPVSYRGWVFQWEKGRQLKGAAGNGHNLSFTYNASGIRTSKTVDGIMHNYVLEGSKILREIYGTVNLDYLYDNEESVCGLKYNGTPYYFYKNLQGDIIAITSSSGQVVARYTYDAWGVCIGIWDNSGVGIASINPFRYRGYYWDQETGLFYVGSRYYDPEIGRFINADEANVLFLTNNQILGANLFAYCDNNPLNNSDPMGYLSLSSALAKVGELLNKVVNMFINYLSKLIIYNKGKRTLSISTTVIAVAIDALIAAIINGLIYRGVKLGMNLLLRSQSVRNSFVGGMFNFFLTNKIGKFVLWTIVKIGLIVAGKPGAVGTIIDGLLKDFLANIAFSKSQILQKASSLISAFSSVGGIVALFIDLMDRKWDNYATLKV